ncbi:uncharacterized protein EHS24_005861 [Apiotrichum porosum]|uniref:Transglycosylase SLT domain-containing protein n=1 Tax=Apiotrichum porosum TaxID=105984 RepID=A0A427XZT7_9TREE|nr:uncharacterized protein EHS24_005861 [Apiotrichum porosum]RSH84341.1 hypothetical protein EHS24_005861 [Apiotrichum porosum]
MVAANTIALLTLLPALALAAVSPNHDSALARSNAHRGNAPRAIGSAQSRSRRRGQCRVRPAATEASAAAPAPTEESATPAEESTTPAEESTPTEESTTTTGSEDEAQTEGDSQAADTTEQPTTSASAEQEAESTPVNNNLAALPNSNSGLLYTTGPCGDNQPDADHPNGQQWWFNCGIDDNGWNPPFLTFDQIKYQDLAADGIYAPCAPYFDKFYAASGKYNIPPIMIAAIAMQESTCQPELTGGGGEAGMMQLLGSNCDGAPNGDCYDVDFNIDRGVYYLRDRIDANGGSVLLGMGAYNGWEKGMTRGDVYEKANTWGCFAQQNLDYMEQTLNGWLQNQYGYERGSINNRKDC